MKDRLSLRLLIFTAAALFVFVIFCIFFIFNTSYQRTDHIIQLPREQVNTSVGAQGSITGIQLNDAETFSVPASSISLLVRSIPANVPYQIRGIYRIDGTENMMHIYFRDGKCKIVLAAGTAAERHLLILLDRYYTWSRFDSKASMYLTDSPYKDCGFSFLDMKSLRGENPVFIAENEASFGQSSLSFAFTVNKIRHVYTVSSASGCVFSYSARRGGQTVEQFVIESILLGVPPESQFIYPGENIE